MKTELQFFEDFAGESAISFVALPQSGSSRVNYIAETSTKKFVVTKNYNLRENEAFFYFSKVFSELHLNTPHVYKISDDRKMYVQEYLGDKTLSQVIEKEKLSKHVRILVQRTLDQLFHLQNVTFGKIDYSKTFEYEIYDELPVLNDLFYFKKLFVDVLEVEYHKSTLIKEFKKLVDYIETLSPKGLMIRDFQSRNIMLDEQEKLSFIDYQSAMEGPLMYDVVSFLFQAKANFSNNFRNEMLAYYIEKYPEHIQMNLQKSIAPLQLMRYIQVLGVYGLRGLVQGKSHFIASINQGITNLSHFSTSWNEMYKFPELQSLISSLNTTEVQEKIKLLTQKK